MHKLISNIAFNNLKAISDKQSSVNKNKYIINGAAGNIIRDIIFGYLRYLQQIESHRTLLQVLYYQ